MMNPFPFSDDNKRYHTYTYAMRQRFGGKVSRISLNAGFSCPNLDGTKGVGGCTYCSPLGSGEFAGDPRRTISEQFVQIASQMDEKWEGAKHIAYFQARTNTYAPVETLRTVYEQALACPGVVGLAISTRPDCLPDPVCDLLAELHTRTYLTVELGLQSIHPQTADKINRAHSWEEFLQGYQKLQQRGIPIGIHIINGLPGETHQMMVQTAAEIAKLRPHLLKIHLLHLLSNTAMARDYQKQQFALLTREEYVSIVCDQLEILPPETIIGRLTGDGAPDSLIGPAWSLKKLCVLNEVDKELVRRNSWQGKAF